MPECLPAMGDRAGSNRSQVDAKETFQTLFEMSRLLNTGLDMETLAQYDGRGVCGRVVFYYNTSRDCS